MKKLTTKQFIEKAKQVHGNKYDYSKTQYINCRTNLIIVCPIHGEFSIRPDHHIKSCGCPKCGYANIGKALKHTTQDFINKAIQVHGSKYNYSKVDYRGSFIPVIIICPKHGEFKQIPNSHIHLKEGCPKCSQSKGELTIQKYLEEHNINYIYQYTIPIDISINSSGRASIDFYLPDYNTFIEYNGIQHYIPQEHFGGKIKFEQQQNRDNFVRKYCKYNNICLLELKYDANIIDALDQDLLNRVSL